MQGLHKAIGRDSFSYSPVWAWTPLETPTRQKKTTRETPTNLKHFYCSHRGKEQLSTHFSGGNHGTGSWSGLTSLWAPDPAQHSLEHCGWSRDRQGQAGLQLQHRGEAAVLVQNTITQFAWGLSFQKNKEKSVNPKKWMEGLHLQENVAKQWAPLPCPMSLNVKVTSNFRPWLLYLISFSSSFSKRYTHCSGKVKSTMREEPGAISQLTHRTLKNPVIWPSCRWICIRDWDCNSQLICC